jgi:hypothetical protein
MSNRVCDARIKLTSPETSGAEKRALSSSLSSVLELPSAIYTVLIKYKGNARAKHVAGGRTAYFIFRRNYFSLEFPPPLMVN